MNREKKRGLTNIEMIVAVTIFVFSIVLVVYYITFVGFRQEPSEIFLTSLERSLRNETEVSYNVTAISIASDGDCFKIRLHSSISSEEENVLIGVPFNISGGNLFVDNQGQFLIRSFPIRVSSERLGSCSNIAELEEGQGYNYSIAYQDSVFVYGKLRWLRDNYQSFKNKYQLQRDFSINITDKTSGSLLMSIAAPTKALEVPIKAKQFHATVIQEHGYISEVIINMQVW